MGESLPWFKMYPQEFMGDENVQLMGPTELGVYMAMLLHQWKAGAVPDDPKMVARICRGDVRQVEEAWPLVRPCFDPCSEKEGFLCQPRLEAEREAALNRREAARKAAKARSESAERGEDGRFEADDPAKEPAEIPAKGPAAAGADGGAPPPAKGPATRASDASEAQRDRSKTEKQNKTEHRNPEKDHQPASARARAALADWLENTEVVDSFHDRFGENYPHWALAVKGHHVNGTRDELWRDVPQEDRPTVLQAAMWSFVGDAPEYDNRLFEGYVKRAVRVYRDGMEESAWEELGEGDKKVIDLRKRLEKVDLAREAR